MKKSYYTEVTLLKVGGSFVIDKNSETFKSKKPLTEEFVKSSIKEIGYKFLGKYNINGKETLVADPGVNGEWYVGAYRN